jgi:predicted neutral ceramidase superfamily lipid hydrolase
MNASGSKDNSSRVEREVLEILERSEAAQNPVENLQATVRRQRATMGARVTQSSMDARLRSLVSGGIAKIAAALLLAILAAVVADASRLLAFVFAINDSTRWRGQDLRGRGPSSPFGGGGKWPPKPPR